MTTTTMMMMMMMMMMMIAAMTTMGCITLRPLLAACFLCFELIFCREDGGSSFFPNVAKLTNCAASHLRRLKVL
jgi:hypothetical protein